MDKKTTKVTMLALMSMEISSRILREEMAANADIMTPIEVAGQMRFVEVLEAAEKMADAIDAYKDSAADMAEVPRSLGEAAERFRKAARGGALL